MKHKKTYFSRINKFLSNEIIIKGKVSLEKNILTKFLIDGEDLRFILIREFKDKLNLDLEEISSTKLNKVKIEFFIDNKKMVECKDLFFSLDVLNENKHCEYFFINNFSASNYTFEAEFFNLDEKDIFLSIKFSEFSTVIYRDFEKNKIITFF